MILPYMTSRPCLHECDSRNVQLQRSLSLTFTQSQFQKCQFCPAFRPGFLQILLCYVKLCMQKLCMQKLCMQKLCMHSLHVISLFISGPKILYLKRIVKLSIQAPIRSTKRRGRCIRHVYKLEKNLNCL